MASATLGKTKVHVQFWGAARTVTGSMHLLECNGHRVLLDCGLFQGRRREAFERNRTLPFDPAGIGAVVVSHAHIDHTGNLPSLVKGGFQGPIFSTSATRDLASVMLLDSAKIQEQDIEYVNRRKKREGRSLFEPLYTTEQAVATIRRFRSIDFSEWFDVLPGIRCRYHLAGHMLGAASVELLLNEPGSREIRLLFSGDIGRPGMPILPDPRWIAGADYVIMEATYGDRLHEKQTDSMEMLREIAERTWKSGGKLVIPAFSVGRTQEIIYRLNLLAEDKKLPPIKVFVDSPLSVAVTDFFRSHVECLDEEMIDRILNEADGDPLMFQNLVYVRKVEQSKMLNLLKEPCVIVSASGMCEAGRILHHLKHNLSDPNSTVLFTGFQAPHTLGRRILDGATTVRIFDDEYPVRARIARLEGNSGHADQGELLEWAAAANRDGTVRRYALVHAEMPAASDLKQRILARGLPKPVIPDRGDRMELV